MALATDRDPNIFSSSQEARVDFECSECGGRLSVKVSKAGTRGKCPFCGDSVEATYSRSQTLEVAVPRSAERGFRANRVIMPSEGYDTDDSWCQRYDRQKRKWMRRRSFEKWVERFGEALLVNRGRLMGLVGILVVGVIGVGLLAFGLISSR